MKSPSFIGRKGLLEDLALRFHDDKADLVLIYGRRRVGKSRLIHEFVRDKKNVFFFTGVETSGVESTSSRNHRQIQIKHFLATLEETAPQIRLRGQDCSSWEDALGLLHSCLPEKDVPCCLIFDEFPWMAGQRLELVRVLFKFWELKWSQRRKFMLIVCGSSVGFLDKHFLRSTQFYGRSTMTIHLPPLTIFEVGRFFGTHRSFEEALEFYMIFGGIPKYLEQIHVGDSLRRAVNRLCFSSGGIFVDEVSHLLRSSFMRESDKYHQIIKLLTRHDSLNYEDLAVRTKSAKGGSLKHLIQNLVQSDMIERFVPMDRFSRTNLFRLRLSDEFMRFYYLFMDPHIHLIQENKKDKDIYDIIIPQRLYYSWKGKTFERIVQKHAFDIAEKAGFSPVVKNFGSYFLRSKNAPQIDLIYLRTDKTLTVAEIKYSERPIQLTAALVTQIRAQKDFLSHQFAGKRIEHYLITNNRPTEQLLRSEVFHRVINFFDLLD